MKLRNSPHRKSRIRAWLANHRKVSLESLKRLWTQPVAMMMTAAVIAIALALPGGLYVVLDNVSHLSGDWDESTQISLFLKTGIQKESALKLRSKLEKHQLIKKVEFISKERGLKQFKEVSGFGDALKYLEDNPLPDVLVVHPKKKANQPERIQKLVKELKKNKNVELAQLDVQWVKRLYTFLEIANRSIWVLSIMLSIAVLLIIGNTIRLDIQNRREEIEVSKLIGASDAFIRRPFLYTGIWYGFIGGILAWITILVAQLLMEGPVQHLALLYHSNFELSGLGFLNTMILIIISCLLGLIGSWIAVGRHLREIEPS